MDGKQSDEEIAKAWEVSSPPASPPVREDSFTLRGNLGRSEGMWFCHLTLLIRTEHLDLSCRPPDYRSINLISLFQNEL